MATCGYRLKVASIAGQDGYQVVHIKGPNGELEDAIIDRIYQDPQGYIWIASLQAGLFRYDPTSDTYQQFIAKPTTEEQIFIESVFSMVAVDDKTLWLGRGWDFAKLDLETKKITSIFEILSELKAVLFESFSRTKVIFLWAPVMVLMSMSWHQEKSVNLSICKMSQLIFIKIM